MSSTIHEQAVAVLDSYGLPPENMFLLPGDSENEGLIVFWYPQIGMRFLILENDALATACYLHLREREARRFDSPEQILSAAAAEKWPGWDTCEPSLQHRNQKR